MQRVRRAAQARCRALGNPRRHLWLGRLGRRRVRSQWDGVVTGAVNDDLLRKLDTVAALKTGQAMPEEFEKEFGVNNWGRFISKLAADAAEEIRRLENTNKRLMKARDWNYKELEAEEEYRKQIKRAGEAQEVPGYWNKLYPDGRPPE